MNVTCISSPSASNLLPVSPPRAIFDPRSVSPSTTDSFADFPPDLFVLDRWCQRQFLIFFLSPVNTYILRRRFASLAAQAKLVYIPLLPPFCNNRLPTPLHNNDDAAPADTGSILEPIPRSMWQLRRECVV